KPTGRPLLPPRQSHLRGPRSADPSTPSRRSDQRGRARAGAPVYKSCPWVGVRVYTHRLTPDQADDGDADGLGGYSGGWGGTGVSTGRFGARGYADDREVRGRHALQGPDRPVQRGAAADARRGAVRGGGRPRA